MNEEIKEKTQTLSPFTKLCMTIGQLPSSYIESMTYYEQLIWFTKYLQEQVIPAVNQNAAAVLELQGYYLELQEYVNNYFDNLDVQEEINNKLDEMAEDGTLTNLIKNYVDPFIINQNNKIVELDNKISTAVNMNPLVASSTSEMTDTSKIYVNTTNGKWYYYNSINEEWTIGGDYQSAVSSSDTTLVTPLAYTNVASINGLIKECQIINKSDTYVNYKIQLYAYNTNSSRIYGIDASNNETRIDTGGINRRKGYDTTYKLFMYDDANVTIKMIFDWSKVTSDTTFTFKPIAYQFPPLFNVIKFPNDKNIEISGVGVGSVYLQDLMEVRNAIKSIYLKSDGTESFKIELFNGNNSTYAVRIKNGNTNLVTKTFTQNYKGIILLDDYGAIDIDTSVLTQNYYAPINLINYEDYKNYELADISNNGGRIFYCGSTRPLSTLKAGIEEATKYMNSTLYVDEGTYDLISEFGSSYFENLTASSSLSGLVLKNNIHVIFSANSKVISNYTGDNQYAQSLYSPFNAGKYGFTIENLTLECSRCRYAVHDERNGAIEEYQANYLNCKMKLDNSENDYWDSRACIGGGLGSNASININNCIFESDQESAIGNVYYHQSNDLTNTNFKGNITINGCYFITGTISLSKSRSDSTADPHQYVITNNSMKKYSNTTSQGIYLNGLSESAIYAWNNNVRNN